MSSSTRAGRGRRARIDCGPDTAVHVTTQAATNVYRAERNFATQLVNLRVRTGAILEYLPEPLVPYRGSRFFQRTSLTVHPDSTAILGEVLLAGRAARGERHAHDIYWAETDALDISGRLLFADTLRISPGEFAGPSLGMLGDHDVVGTLFMLTKQATNELVELLREALAEHSTVLSGIGELPNESGVVVRLLGPSSKAARAALRSTWSSVRLELIGAPAPDPP